MLQWDIGIIETIDSACAQIEKLQVRMRDGSLAQAILYTSLLGEAQIGERVLLNTTAVRLQLGTGGVHFVAAFADRKPQSAPSAPDHVGHIMKLRYTPLQHAVLAVEEPDSPYHPSFRTHQDLGGMPVLIGELHSMLPIAATWSRSRTGPEGRRRLPRTVYIMSDGGALPISFSEHVRQLTRAGWLEGSITYGHAYGGDSEAINKFTALIAAKVRYRAELAIVTTGPGIVGTGTLMGHSAMEIGEIVNAINKLAGKPIVLPRISFHDGRTRHDGISHHLLSALRYATATPAILPLPLLPERRHGEKLESQAAQIPGMHRIEWRTPPDPEHIQSIMNEYPLPIRTMGRSVREDPCFFQAVCTAVDAAMSYLDI